MATAKVAGKVTSHETRKWPLFDERLKWAAMAERETRSLFRKILFSYVLLPIWSTLNLFGIFGCDRHSPALYVTFITYKYKWSCISQSTARLINKAARAYSVRRATITATVKHTRSEYYMHEALHRRLSTLQLMFVYVWCIEWCFAKRKKREICRNIIHVLVHCFQITPSFISPMNERNWKKRIG